jgi:hypothetical protein
MIASDRLSPRLAALRADAIARQGAFVRHANPLLCDVALWRSFAAGQSRVQRRAAFLRELVVLAPVDIGPAWSLAGEHLRPLHAGVGACGNPALAACFAEFGIDATEAEAVRRCAGAWNGDIGTTMPRGTLHTDVGVAAPGSESGKGGWGGTTGMDVFWSNGWIENHSIRDFAKVLRVGFAGILEEIDAALAGGDLTDPDFPRKENFWRGARSVCEAGILLGKRYAALAAERAAATADPDDKARLERMAEVCAQVPARGARNFHEAVQALWFAHILTCGEDGINANSIGRLDQILFSFLCNLDFGRCLGATPDGRKAGEPIAYSLSAQQGRDERGATAMLKSLAHLPHDRAAGASAAIIELDPAVVEGEAGVERLTTLMRAALAMEIGQLQFNVVTVEKLRQAQKDPEHYGDLPVRVAGFSQKFKLVPPDLQEHIIARTKHTSTA